MVVRYIRKGPQNYTTSGSPTITNNVATDLYKGDLRLSNFPYYTAESWEIGVNVVAERNTTEQQRIVSFEDTAYNDMVLLRTIRQSNGTERWGIGGQNAYIGGTEHTAENFPFAKIIKKNSKLYFYLSADGEDYQELSSDIALSSALDGILKFGYNSTNVGWYGSLLLDDTYVKVNGELFAGQEIFIPKTQIIHNTYNKIKDDVLLEGEPAFEEDTNSLKVGDGITKYDELPCLVDNNNKWIKPKEWIDLRTYTVSPNSVTFLVGHSADYSKYPEFSVQPTIESSGTYDVYVDGTKVATTASNTATILNWQTLALESGWDVTYPEALRTHIVRVETTDSSKTFTVFKLASNSSVEQGVLWAHFNTTNYINFATCFHNSTMNCSILEAVTSENDELKGYFYTFVMGCRSLKYLPILNADNTSIASTSNPLYSMASTCSSLTYIRLKNFTHAAAATVSSFNYCYNLSKIDYENCCPNLSSYGYRECRKLKNILPIRAYNVEQTNNFCGANLLPPIVLDLSKTTSLRYFSLSSIPSINLATTAVKGVIFNPSLTWTSETSPIINVSYTPLDRSALVTMFKSMPTVTDRVCDITGTTGAADLTAEDLAIATNKGWTVTR